MAGLVETREAAITSLRGDFPGFTVMGASGSSDAATILAKYIGRGAIIVMALGASNVADPSSLQLDVNADFAAIVIVHGKKDAKAREDEGLPLAESVALHIHGNTFGLSGASPARVSGISPIADDELSKRGLWAWGITWEQRLALSQ